MTRVRSTAVPASRRRSAATGGVLAPFLRGGLLLAGLIAAAAGCGEASPTAPTPLRSEFLGVAGRAVQWRTDRPTRGSVRYGLVSGRYDRVAYPDAGEDTAYACSHAVRLLGASAGNPVFLRRLDRVRGGDLAVAAEETVLLADPPDTPPLLRFTSVDVHFGDALVLRAPGGAVVLVDAGDPWLAVAGESAPEHLARWLRDHGVQRLAAAAATHAHADHLGGFVRAGADGGDGLLARLAVDRFLDLPAHSGERPDHRTLVARLEELGVPRLAVAPGMTDGSHPDRLGWDPALRVEVLHGGAEPGWSDLNNDSLALRVGYGDVDFLTVGDCEAAAEELMLERFPGKLAGIEVLKAGHHGRSDASGGLFLDAVLPRTALVTVAFAAYREGVAAGAEATAPVLARFAARGTDVFRFDDAEPLGEPADTRTFWHTTLVTDGVSYEIRLEPSVWGLTRAIPDGQP